MNKEYRVQAVSEKLKNWSNAYGDFTTYYIKLDGEGDDAISINKKSDSPAPKEGDELYGEVTETEFGKRIKTAAKPFESHTGGSGAYKSNSKNITLGLVWKTIAGIRGLPEPGDDDDFAKFYDMVRSHYEELVLMQEKAKDAD